MRNVMTIAWRDLRSVFVSPIAYVILTGFLLLSGWFFFSLLGQFNRLISQSSFFTGADLSWLNLNEAVIGPLLENMSVVLLFVTPMMTMRSFAEERSSGTYELLFTAPVKVWEIVLGKYAAGVAMVTLMLGLTMIYPLVLSIYGNPELPMVVTGYTGLFLMAISFVAIGNFTSSLTSNQIIATVSSMVILLLLFVVDWAGEGAGEVFKAVVAHVSVSAHFGNFVRGVIDTADLVYFASLIGLFLFFTHRAVESARWK